MDILTRYMTRNAGTHGPIILMYHAVTPDGETSRWPWSIASTAFETHLDFLESEGWETCTVSELIQRSQFEGRCKTIALTFDDGYENNLLALDALSARGMCSTWFIVSGAIEKHAHWEDTGRPNGKMLSKQNLRDMRAAGMEIGSHSVNHPRLTSLDDQALRDEVTLSKTQLEQVLGEPVVSFAYPYGDWDDRCENTVREAGYSSACTTQTGSALKDRNAFRLRRLSVFNEDSASNLARKLTLLQNEGGWKDMLDCYKSRLAARIGYRGVAQ